MNDRTFDELGADFLHQSKPDEYMRACAELFPKKTPVLDKGWIQLQDVMPYPRAGVTIDRAIVNAARTSHLGESKGDEADKKLLFYLMKNHHDSPFEMAEFKFLVKSPLIVMWQWFRHRMASYNSQSGRYTEFDENEFYTPDAFEWRLQDTKNKQGSYGLLDPREGAEITQLLLDHYARGHHLYQQAINKGVAREQARLFLPGFSVYYRWVWKVDLRNLLAFLRLRADPHAQFEIRVYAEVVLNDYVRVLAPWTYEAWTSMG